jgi:hypothetical protein
MTEEEIAAAVDAKAALVGLPIAEAHRAGVLRYFALAAEMAELVLTVPLGRDDESAAVFRPAVPPEAP